VALLIGGVAVGQIVTLSIVLLTPPPRPPLYRLSEIAAALDGQLVKPRDGHPLIRAVGRPPAAGVASAGFANAARLELAGLLKVSPDRVRLLLDAPLRPPWAAPFQGERDAPMAPPLGSPPLGPRPSFPFGDLAGPIVGDFKAAVRDPAGEWVVVAPQADPFPNAWQGRLIVWFLICLAVLGPAGFLFARRLVAPIGAFAQAANQLGRDPGAPLMELRGPAEIGVAARAFNNMQERLKRYIDDRTAMIGAIAHDLRTPLARIRFKVEAGSAELRASVDADIDQMEAMISAVLTFVRDASGPNARTVVDLLSVLECAVDDAQATGCEVELQSNETPEVGGDALALQRLFANLIDNAVTYGRRASVSLRTEDDTAVTEIVDEGPGLPIGELERVFEPFYRAEPSRSRRTGGIGLGLAVARSIARAHSGDVLLQPSARGLAAIVRLPLARPSDEFQPQSDHRRQPANRKEKL